MLLNQSLLCCSLFFLCSPSCLPLAVFFYLPTALLLLLCSSSVLSGMVASLVSFA